MASKEADATSWHPLPVKKRFAARDVPQTPATPAVPEPSKATGDDEESDPYPELEQDGFDEYYVKDAEDYNQLMALNELHREAVLTERQEQRRDMEARNAIKIRQWEERRKAKGKSTKAKRLKKGRDVDVSDEEEPPKKRQKTTQKRALEEIARKRAKRTKDDLYDEDDDEEEESPKRKRKGKKAQSDSEDADYMEIAAPQIEEKPAPRQAEAHRDQVSSQEPLQFERELYPASLDDFRHIVVRRKQVEAWYGEPYWNIVIRGLYCRVSVGQNPALPGKDKSVYRVAEIVDIVEHTKTYKLGDNKECNQVAMLRIHGKQKAFELKFFSNGEVTPEEYEFFVKVQRKANERVVTKEDCEELYKNHVKFAEDYTYSDKDVEEAVKRNRAKKPEPVNLFKEKKRLEEEIATAKIAENINPSRVKELEAQLEAIQLKEEKKRQHAEESKKVRVSLLNAGRREQDYRQRDEERERILKRERDELEGLVHPDEDPFARRKIGVAARVTKPAPPPQPATDQLSARPVAPNSLPAVSAPAPTSPLPSVAPPATPVKDNIDDDMDVDELGLFDDEVTVKAATSRPSAGTPNAAASAQNPPGKRALSLADYQARRGKK